MAREYDCRCNNCGRTWYFNDADLKKNENLRREIKGRTAIGIANVLGGGGPIGNTWQVNRVLDVGESAINYTRCPACQSNDVYITYTEVENAFLDDPKSPLYSPVGIGSDAVPENAKNKTIAAVLAIFLGAIGAHKFYLGYTTEGITMLVIFIIGRLIHLQLIGVVLFLIGVIEGIIYLTHDKSDFYNTYELRHKGWF